MKWVRSKKYLGHHFSEPNSGGSKVSAIPPPSLNPVLMVEVTVTMKVLAGAKFPKS